MATPSQIFTIHLIYKHTENPTKTLKLQSYTSELKEKGTSPY